MEPLDRQPPASTIKRSRARYQYTMIRNLLKKYTAYGLFAAMCLLLPGTASAFDTSVFAENSRLADGRWMKISVDADGMYMLTPSQLRSWGFSDISKVRVYGYGGRRLPDVLRAADYRDDIPEVPSVLTDKGLVFYAVGPHRLVTSYDEGFTYLQQNDYSNESFYFVGETDGSETPGLQPTGIAGATSPVRTYTATAQHETEQTAVPGEAGPLLLGEEFRFTRKRSFSVAVPGAVSGEVAMMVSFVSDISGSGSRLSFTVNGTKLEAEPDDAISARPQSHYVHGVETTTVHRFEASPSSRGTYETEISLSVAGSCTGAWLNFLSFNYPAALQMPQSGYLCFSSDARQLALGGADESVSVWDVTDPHNPLAVKTSLNGSEASWTATSSGKRSYAAWKSGVALPAPKTAAQVPNQNLHADRDYDMVIVTPSQYASEASRLAAMHENSADKLKVRIVYPEQIYNEFSSGALDPGGIRRYFKMLYDRGADEGSRPLKYAILMARTTIDNRNISASSPSYPALPSWMPEGARNSLSDNDGYCTDDYTAMLDDGSGASPRTDKLSIALGRIPVTDINEARLVVDKALQYAEGSRKTSWKHRYMFLADDQDNSIHMKQTESMISQFENADRQQHLVRKVYMDAYPFIGSTYPEARSAMYRYLDEGVVWWNFVGHASTTGWTGEKMLSYTDLNQLYLRHWPFIYAATCDFLRLDGSRITGGEILYKERYGGAIGIISAVRPVYISDNGLLSNAMGRALALRESDGRLLPPGEIYRRAKNDIRDVTGRPVGDDNRLRYVFIGDPALRLAMPSNIVSLDSVDGIAVDGDSQPTMQALGKPVIKGSVTDPDGKLLENFNGVVLIEIFDAERSRVTLASRDESTAEPFEDYGERVFCGSTEVRGGRFELTAAMPMEVSQNFRPAAMSLYAYSTEDDTEAVGLNRAFYIYGYNDNAAADTSAPEIESLVLNHSTFRSGDTVNDSPMIIASVRDDVGLNMSSTGIGHQMTATVDGTRTYNDLSFYFTPSPDGSPSGTVNYPLEGLQPGNHTLSVRIWDTSGNSATKEVDFFVQENLAPKIYDVYTDANPASTQANFYLSHDQPDNMLTVSVTVYTLTGRPVWTGSASGRSDMFLTVPVTWDLTDSAGRRVGRGIYLYRASVTSDGKTFETASRRIAVTAR